MPAFRTLVVSRAVPDVDVVTLNRPGALNALSGEMVAELLRYFGDLERAGLGEPAAAAPPRVVILKGQGRAFCAGLDLQETSTGGSSSFSGSGSIAATFQVQRRISEIIVRMRRCPQPIIALLQGAVCGGGLALALGSDVRLACKDMKCNVAMASIGLSGCDVGISYLLPRCIGSSRANEMCLTGRFVMADKADKWGLVNDVFPDYATLEKAGMDMAVDMLKLSALGTVLTKQGMNLSLQAGSLEAQVALEDRQQTVVSRDPEFAERVKSFVGKGKGKSGKL